MNYVTLMTTHQKATDRIAAALLDVDLLLAGSMSC